MDANLLSTNFQALDWVIVAVYLAASVVIGVVANRYIANLADYLVAGRGLRVWLAVATMTGTELGLVTVVYNAEMGFRHQFAALHLGLLELGALLAIGLTGLIVYRLRQTGVMTIPEFYGRRYNRPVRVVGGVVLALAGILNMGLFLQAGSRFLTGLTGLPEGVWLKVVMTGLLLLVLLYTVLGGMVSVVLTDLLQFLVLGTAMVLVSVLVIWHVGWDMLAKLPASQEGPAAFNPLLPESELGTLYIVYQGVVIFTASMLWPAGAQRTLSVKTPAVAKQLYLCSAVTFLGRRALPMLWGIAAFVFFAQAPLLNDSLNAAIDAGQLSTQSAMPLFLAKVLPTGLIGLVAAGLIAAFMSTHDSYLLCWSSVITQDIVAPVVGPLRERPRIWITRVGIVAIGVFLLVWGLWYETPKNLWDYMAITGTIYLAGVLPVVLAGLYWPRANSAGAMAAIVSGLAAILGLEPILEPMRDLLGLPWLRFEHVGLATFAASATAMVVVSLLTKRPSVLQVDRAVERGS